ncbi:hypothetical protein FA95DRAFT_1611958 [Auriscalpium vulgare]|uniref:Uncharacterized protein n=1 Tax=Auriscalpium vulgare TaxID=40419 RepID=A0ACB8R899_9AGAM|nr:hypothetical protein FA95DRAFT_1611958 [Auriscalpium vulgare]
MSRRTRQKQAVGDDEEPVEPVTRKSARNRAKTTNAPQKASLAVKKTGAAAPAVGRNNTIDDDDAMDIDDEPALLTKDQKSLKTAIKRARADTASVPKPKAPKKSKKGEPAHVGSHSDATSIAKKNKKASVAADEDVAINDSNGTYNSPQDPQPQDESGTEDEDAAQDDEEGSMAEDVAEQDETFPELTAVGKGGKRRKGTAAARQLQSAVPSFHGPSPAIQAVSDDSDVPIAAAVKHRNPRLIAIVSDSDSDANDASPARTAPRPSTGTRKVGQSNFGGQSKPQQPQEQQSTGGAPRVSVKSKGKTASNGKASQPTKGSKTSSGAATTPAKGKAAEASRASKTGDSQAGRGGASQPAGDVRDAAASARAQSIEALHVEGINICSSEAPSDAEVNKPNEADVDKVSHDRGSSEHGEAPNNTTSTSEHKGPWPAHTNLELSGKKLAGLAKQTPQVHAVITRANTHEIHQVMCWTHAMPVGDFLLDCLRTSLINAADHLEHKDIAARLRAEKPYGTLMSASTRGRMSIFRTNIKRRLAGLDMSDLYEFSKFTTPVAVTVSNLVKADPYLFIFPGDLWDRVYDDTSPYCHAVFVKALRALFLGTKALASFDTPLYVSSIKSGIAASQREVPAAMVAIVAMMITHSLNDWQTGVHIPVDFDSNIYGPIYEAHLTSLKAMKSGNPDGYHKVMHFLYQAGRGLVAERASNPTSLVQPSVNTGINMKDMGANLNLQRGV